jgi:hypothetical protein
VEPANESAHPIYGKSQKDSPIGRLLLSGRKILKWGSLTQNFELPFREKQVTKFDQLNFLGERVRTGVCTGNTLNCPVRVKPPRNREGCYAYSSVAGGKLCLLTGLSRHNIPPTPPRCDPLRFGS